MEVPIPELVQAGYAHLQSPGTRAGLPYGAANASASAAGTRPSSGTGKWASYTNTPLACKCTGNPKTFTPRVASPHPSDYQGLRMMSYTA